MSPRTLRLELAPSPPLAFVIVAAHAAAGACAAAALPGPAGIALAAAFAALGLATAWARALHRAAGSVRALEIAGGALTLVLASGERLAAQPGARRYVGRRLVILPLARPRRGVLVTTDMLPEDSFRALRVWALWGKLPPAAAGQPAA